MKEFLVKILFFLLKMETIFVFLLVLALIFLVLSLIFFLCPPLPSEESFLKNEKLEKCDLPKVYCYDELPPPPGPECDPVSTLDDICYNPGPTGFSLPSSSNFDLTSALQPGAPALDWTTFQFVNIEVYSHWLNNPGDIIDLCNEPDFGNAPYGTHDFINGSNAFDLCGPFTESSPGVFDADGCFTDSGLSDGPNGESYRTEWVHSGNGILNVTFSSPSGDQFRFQSYWRITYSVEDVDGCTQTGTAYFRQQIGL